MRTLPIAPPRVKVLATGGTIANTPSGRLHAGEVAEAIPQLKSVARLDVEEPPGRFLAGRGGPHREDEEGLLGDVYSEAGRGGDRLALAAGVVDVDEGHGVPRRSGRLGRELQQGLRRPGRGFADAGQAQAGHAETYGGQRGEDRRSATSWCRTAGGGSRSTPSPARR